MVIIANIKKTAAYKVSFSPFHNPANTRRKQLTIEAIQTRSTASLAKEGSSERYKDRTQSLLELIDDETIIWAQVLPTKRQPDGE
jgi:hypothetical protein